SARGRREGRRDPTPGQYFGFRIGSDGKLATWDKMLPYFQLIAEKSNRVNLEEVGKTTEGNPYVLLTISSPKNLANLDNLVEINSRLADPRGLSPTEAEELARTGKPFYMVYAGIHSTEVGNSQATIEWAYRLATEQSEYMNNILDDLVILLVPVRTRTGSSRSTTTLSPRRAPTIPVPIRTFTRSTPGTTTTVTGSC
ncbi:hypothetical protein JNW88_24645, partial [Micromonospora sp. ATA32]|nr:hypothetical protein [Micromonospora sp. ATA32]